MLMSRLSSVQIYFYFILFSVFALAALQNVTVDDAAVTGTAAPVYLPVTSDWRQGNNCPQCDVNPDPALAYDGTWHNGRYFPNAGVELEYQVSFVGSGLYIFFILANTVPNIPTLTNVSFYLDGVLVSSFKHEPLTSTDFEYNQVVYANDSIPYGQHTMAVMPVNDSVNSVVILFDYLIYTTDNSSNSSTSPSSVPVPVQSPTPSLTSSSTSSSSPNVGAIAGGTIGGVAGLQVLVAACIICYRRHKKRLSEKPPSIIANVVEPYVLSPEMAPTSSQGTSLSTQQIRMVSPFSKPLSRREPAGSAPLVATQPPDPPRSTPTHTSSSAPSNGGNTEILEQVGMLRNEVARLRQDRDMGWGATSERSEPPPSYTHGSPR